MEAISITDDEIEWALKRDHWGETWKTFFRFLATQIVRIKNSVNIPEPGGSSWEVWYSDFLERSVQEYRVLVLCSVEQDLGWWRNSSSGKKLFCHEFISFLAQTVAKKKAAIAAMTGRNSGDVDPPKYDSTPALGRSLQEKTPASSTGTMKPRPLIRFATRQLHSGLDKLSDTIYLYYSSPPVLSSVLRDLRKRHELGPSGQFGILRVETPAARIRVLVGEEQEDWDWEGVIENIAWHNDKAYIFFEMQPE